MQSNRINPWPNYLGSSTPSLYDPVKQFGTIIADIVFKIQKYDPITKTAFDYAVLYRGKPYPVITESD